MEERQFNEAVAEATCVVIDFVLSVVETHTNAETMSAIITDIKRGVTEILTRLENEGAGNTSLPSA